MKKLARLLFALPLIVMSSCLAVAPKYFYTGTGKVTYEVCPRTGLVKSLVADLEHIKIVHYLDTTVVIYK